MNILVFTSLWPNREEPNFCVFVKHRALALSRIEGVDLRVVAPVPYFPKEINSRLIPRGWRVKAQIPEREAIDGVEVFRPRYLLTPKVGMSFYARWMASGAESLLRRLHSQCPIDLIDAHYVYPDGYAAIMLGRALNIPVSITARGTDIIHFPKLPLIRPKIRKALRSASGLIAVSSNLKKRMIALGIEAEKIAVIRNGIDRRIFFPCDRAEVRKKLNLDPQSKIIVTVAGLVPRKGIARLIDAMALLNHDRLKLYVIGEGPERGRLESRIARLKLRERVFLPGACPQSKLVEWYSAADLFCLASYDEGCPNVVLEAIACGIPVLAIEAGGVADLIAKKSYGRVVSFTSVKDFAAEIRAALESNWNRSEIADYGRQRSWGNVADELIEYYRQRGIMRHS
ncbi:MAG: glycosyltransferase family 4 protein [Acidobacteria bacterium]|nr:glycosyltransferase family 4 protein [Acidobacteriota bacterium]